jgi:hypothetical protein
MFTPGQTGVFDFNASNAINFGNMVSRFTDEIDEGSLSMEYNLYDVSSTLIGGVGSGGTESQKFGGLLTGRTIDFFRLTVHINSVENFPAGNGFDSRADFTWQVWGSGTPIPNPRPPVPVTAIPEPEMYAMMLAGLGVLGFVARRKKRQAAAA